MTAPRPWYAERFDATYLDVYAHRDDAEARTAIESLLLPHGLEGRDLLDLACGAGRHLRLVERHGARVVGLDLSQPLLSRAQSAGLGNALGLVRGDMLRLPFASVAFDRVLSMFTSFGYFESADEDRAMLAEIHRVLRPGGFLLLDFLNTIRVEKELVPKTHRTSGRYQVLELRHVEEDTRVLVKDIELRFDNQVRRYRERVRLWSATELATALVSTGLRVEALYGDYTGTAYDPTRSPRLIARAHRPES